MVKLLVVCVSPWPLHVLSIIESCPCMEPVLGSSHTVLSRIESSYLPQLSLEIAVYTVCVIFLSMQSS